MDEDGIVAVLRRNLLVVMPDLDPASITVDRSLAELGYNSVDRADVLTMTMEDLGVTVPITEFQEVGDLRSLIDLLNKHT